MEIDVINESIQVVVDYLDELMEQAPNRELADVSNYLQAMLDKRKGN